MIEEFILCYNVQFFGACHSAPACGVVLLPQTVWWYQLIFDCVCWGGGSPICTNIYWHQAVCQWSRKLRSQELRLYIQTLLWSLKTQVKAQLNHFIATFRQKLESSDSYASTKFANTTYFCFDVNCPIPNLTDADQ